MTRFEITVLGKHNRSEFGCGTDALDRYFHKQVGQDVRRRVSTCFVAMEAETNMVAGFYTLSASLVRSADLPDDIRRNIPMYPDLPAVLLGRLAVDKRFQGQGLGSTMLANAVLRVAANEVAIFAMIVDAKDAIAEGFYARHGFRAFGPMPGRRVASVANLMGR